jgi:hypothetical protein
MNVAVGSFNTATNRTSPGTKEDAGASGRAYNDLMPLTGDALHAYQCSVPSMTVDSPKDPDWRPDRNSDFIICYRNSDSQRSYDVWIGEQSVPATSQIGQRTQILNLTDEYNTEQLGEFGWIRFNRQPDLTDAPGRHSDAEFCGSKTDIDGSIYDPTISSLASTLLLAHDASGSSNLWLTDSVARILHVYFSRTYGKLRERRNRYSSLAPWQERRAKELMGQD